MHSNKSRAIRKRIALQPQRSHGKLRVAALLEAGADVIAKKGFQAATMTEIAAKAGAPIGSLYRFFPNKEILADALVQRYGELVDDTFAKINSQIKSLSTAALAEGLLNIMADFQREKRAIRALLEAQSDSSAKREEFRTAMRRRVAKTLRLRNPRLGPELAMDMAVVVIQNMKTVVALNQELRDGALSGALAELRQMTRLYLEARLGQRPQPTANLYKAGSGAGDAKPAPDR